jgi:molybdopterin molybdotransferase
VIPVEKALERILTAFTPLPAEQVSLSMALGRVVAEEVRARLTQPPVAVSAMDGYAVRATDVRTIPITLRQVGEAPAGAAYAGRVGPGETVRIFTGGPVPEGANAIVIQEDTAALGAEIEIRASVPKGHYIRAAGLDFEEGYVGLSAGRVLTARDIGLAAAMNVPWLSVRRRPRVAILASGDEIVMPGDPVEPNQIVSSNGHALAAFVAARGGEASLLGIAGDTAGAIQSLAAGSKGSDLLITTGGASVGAHDIIQEALAEDGLALDFWRIAMRPGKPLMFGDLAGTPMLGLPGNPVSAVVCAVLFLGPVLDRLLGIEREEAPAATALLATGIGANDLRQDYLRALLRRDRDGNLVATPFDRQDSSMVSLIAKADCLIVRPPFAPPAEAGDRVEIIPLAGGILGI